MLYNGCMKKFPVYFLIFSTTGIAGFVISYFLFYKQPTVQTNNPPAPADEVTTIAPTFSLEEAPKQSLQGTITSMSGDVVWTSRIATEPSQLKENTPIQQGENIETDKNGNITLSLGTELLLTLLPDSRLQFIQTIPDHIIFQQDKGDVSYTKTNGSPVSIRAFGLSTQIIDGKVLITMDTDRLTATIKIQKGTATFAYNDLDYQSHVVTYSTGSALIYDSDSRSLEEK